MTNKDNNIRLSFYICIYDHGYSKGASQGLCLMKCVKAVAVLKHVHSVSTLNQLFPAPTLAMFSFSCHLWQHRRALHSLLYLAVCFPNELSCVYLSRNYVYLEHSGTRSIGHMECCPSPNPN